MKASSALFFLSTVIAGTLQDSPVPVITEPSPTFGGPTAPARPVSFSHDGKRLVAGSINSLVKIWNVEDGEEVRTLGGHEGAVTGLAYSPDGAKLAAGSWGTKLFTVETGKQTH